jgi:hypothetical protein
MGKLKAISHLDTVKTLVEKYGQNAIEKVKATLNDLDRAALYGPEVLPITWLDLDLIMRN